MLALLMNPDPGHFLAGVVISTASFHHGYFLALANYDTAQAELFLVKLAQSVGRPAACRLRSDRLNERLVMTVKSLMNGAAKAAKAVGNKMREWAGEVRDFVAENSRKVAIGLGLGGTALVESSARADGAPDASAIVTTAQTTFDAVGALVAAAVGFFIIVKIVKWIRK